MKTSEIQIAAIHNVEGARLRDKQIECVDIVDLAFGNMDKRGDIAPQIHQRMEFDGPLGAAKMGPGEDGKTKIDGRGIERIDRVGEFDAKGISHIELAC